MTKRQKYKLSENKTLIIKANYASVKMNDRLHTKHQFSLNEDIEIKAAKVIDPETVILKANGHTFHLKISGTSITVY